MRISGNTVLITGGSSGIGFALARQLTALGNTVIVTGRHAPALGLACERLPAAHAIQSDVSDPHAIAKLYRTVVRDYPQLNVVINNAGVMRKLNLRTFGTDLNDVTREIDANLNGTIRMCIQFLPHLMTQQRAALVNVSSGLAFVPTPIAPVYCASKAAIHSFTQSLRVQLQNTNVAVFELAPPLTQTGLFKGDFNPRDVAPIEPMNVEVLVRKVIQGMENDRLKIRPGLSNVLKLMSRVAPGFMLCRLSIRCSGARQGVGATIVP